MGDIGFYQCRLLSVIYGPTKNTLHDCKCTKPEPKKCNFTKSPEFQARPTKDAAGLNKGSYKKSYVVTIPIVPILQIMSKSTDTMFFTGRNLTIFPILEILSNPGSKVILRGRYYSNGKGCTRSSHTLYVVLRASVTHRAPICINPQAMMAVW